MTTQNDRRSRIVNLRAIEHRVAQYRVVEADNALAALRRTNDRLRMLNAGLNLGPGPHRGAALQAMSEMTGRLGDASLAMAAPISEAETVRAGHVARHIAARQNQHAAEKLKEKADKLATAERERIADANRPFIRRTSLLTGAV